MSILIISTCKEKLHELEFVNPILEILAGEKIKAITKNYKKVTKTDLEKCDKVIICGTSLKDFEYLKNLTNFNWILTFEKPILGICAGMQILFTIYQKDSLTKNLNKGEIGIITVKFEKDFFGLIGPCEVYELHNMGLDINKAPFKPYALSNAGVQAAKHNKKPHYGCLFHPEVRNKKVILGFIKNG